MYRLLLVLVFICGGTLVACSNGNAKVKGEFQTECAKHGNSSKMCACAYDFAADVFTTEQLQFYRAVTFNNTKDLAKYKAKLGFIKGASLLTRVGIVEGDITASCGRLTAKETNQ